MALWALASLAFAFGLTLFPDYGAVYGSFGAAISLLLYLYVSAAAVLLGAELTRRCSANHRRSRGPLQTRRNLEDRATKKLPETVVRAGRYTRSLGGRAPAREPLEA